MGLHLNGVPQEIIELRKLMDNSRVHELEARVKDLERRLQSSERARKKLLALLPPDQVAPLDLAEWSTDQWEYLDDVFDDFDAPGRN